MRALKVISRGSAMAIKKRERSLREIAAGSRGGGRPTMDCRERVYAGRAGSIYGIKGSFLFAPLRGHPRFTALLRKMNLA